MQNTVDLTTISHLLELTPRRVQQLCKDGILITSGRGKYLLQDSLLNYIKFLKSWRAPASIPCNADDLAAYLALTKGQIFYLAKIGAIPVVEHGRFDLATGIQGYLAFIREQYKEGHDGKAGRRAPWQSPTAAEIEKAAIMPLSLERKDDPE